jgi:hypothetical protein
VAYPHGRAVAALALTGVGGPPAPSVTSPLEREYWLGHCDGFRVDGRRGRIGVVEEVRPAKGGDTLLVIRLGMLGLKSVAISTREVFEIVPRDRRLWLRTPVSVSVEATESTPELLEPQRARVAA